MTEEAPAPEEIVLLVKCGCEGTDAHTIDTTDRNQGRFPFNPKSSEFRLVHQMERTISLWSDRNIRDQH